MKLAYLLLLLLTISCQTEEFIVEESKPIDIKISQEEAILANSKSLCASQELKDDNYYHGEVKLTIRDDFKTGEHKDMYYFKSASGERLNLQESPYLLSLPLNEKGIYQLKRTQTKSLIVNFTIVSQVDPKRIQNSECLKTEMNSYQKFSREKDGAKVTNLNQKRIALIYRDTQGQGFSELPKNSRAREIEAFYTRVGASRYDVSVRVFRMPYNIPQSCNGGNAGCLSALASQANDAFSANGITDLEYKMFVSNASGFGAGGYADLVGFIGVVFSDRLNFILHELGHNFGLNHAGALTSQGIYNEYGDTTSVMGNQTVARPNAYQVTQLNLHDPMRALTLNQTAQVLLSPIEYNSSIVPSGVIQIATLIKSGKKYIVSTRENDFKVYLHTLVGNTSMTLLQATLSSPGQSATLDGMRVEYVARQDDVFRVNIFENSNDPMPATINFPAPLVRSCVGNIPVHANLCSGDDQGLSNNTPRIASSSCTARKCEYTCKSGYELVNGVCVIQDNSQIDYICLMPSGGIGRGPKVLCPGDDQNLDDFENYSLKSSCTPNQKCEYTCAPGYVLDIGNPLLGMECVEDPNSSIEPVEINISTAGYQGAPQSTFRMSIDRVFFNVEGAGPNAKGCIHQELDTAPFNNWGYCDNLSADSDRWFPMSQSSEWSFNNGSWRKQHDFSQGNFNRHPGLYKMFWLNPDTGERGEYEFRLIGERL